MATYEKKTPRFEAFQFDGSEGSAIAIIQSVNALAPSFTVRYLPAMSEFVIENGQVAEKSLPQRLKLFSSLGNEDEVVVNDWVVVDRDGNLEHHTDEIFHQLYQTI